MNPVFSSRSFSSEKKSWKKLKFGKILKFLLASLGSFGRLVGCGVKEGLSLLPLGGAKTFGRMVEPNVISVKLSLNIEEPYTLFRELTRMIGPGWDLTHHWEREKRIKDLHPTGIEPTALFLLVPGHVLLATTTSQPIKIIFFMIEFIQQRRLWRTEQFASEYSLWNFT